MTSPPQDRLSDPGHTGLFRNSVLVAVGQGGIALLFFVYILAARILGDVAFGQFTLGMTVATLLFTLPAWGTGRYASILAARHPGRTREILSSSLGLTGILALVYFPLTWLAASLVAGGSPAVLVALLLGLDLLAREYGNLLRLLLRVHGRYGLDTVTVFVERGLMVAAAAGVLVVRPGPVLLALSLAGGRTLGALATSMVFSRRVCAIGIGFDFRALRGLFSQGAPLAVRRAVATFSFRVDVLFLGIMRSASEVGWYGAVYALMDGVLMLPSVVTGSLGPTLSANYGRGRVEVVTRLYRRGLKYLLLVGLFVGGTFGVLAGPIVGLLYGAEYAPAAGALQMLSLSVLFIFIRRHATEVLDNVDQRSATALIFAGGMLANIALNLLLIPRYGYMGAAAATVATEGFLMTTMLWTLHREGYPSGLKDQLRAPMLSIGIALPLMWSLSGNVMIAALVGAVVYGIGLTLLGAWDEKDKLLGGSVAQRVRELSRTRNRE